MQSAANSPARDPNQAVAYRVSAGASGRSDGDINVGDAERAISAVLGGTLVLLGLRRRSLGGAAMALAGGDLIYRGVRGHCHLYQALGLNTAAAGQGRQAGSAAT